MMEVQSAHGLRHLKESGTLEAGRRIEGLVARPTLFTVKPLMDPIHFQSAAETPNVLIQSIRDRASYDLRRSFSCLTEGLDAGHFWNATLCCPCLTIR